MTVWGADGQSLGRNVKRFQGELVLKAHRLLYPSTLGSRVIKKRRRLADGAPRAKRRGRPMGGSARGGAASPRGRRRRGPRPAREREALREREGARESEREGKRERERERAGGDRRSPTIQTTNSKTPNSNLQPPHTTKRWPSKAFLTQSKYGAYKTVQARFWLWLSG